MLQEVLKGNAKRISKIQNWKKYELFELIDDLYQAEKLLSKHKNGSSSRFESAEEFHNAFIAEIYALRFYNVADFTAIWYWFTPNADWFAFTGAEGAELGKRIFYRVDKWKRNKGSLAH